MVTSVDLQVSHETPCNFPRKPGMCCHVLAMVRRITPLCSRSSRNRTQHFREAQAPQSLHIPSKRIQL